MKKIKILIFLICMFLLTGCNVEYNIEFVDKDIIEETIVTENISEIDKKISKEGNDGEQGEILSYKEYLNQEISNDSYSINNSDQFKYDKKKILNKDIFGIKQKYKFNVSNYQYSSTASMCYKYFKFYPSNDIYILSTSKGFSCFNNEGLNRVTVHLKTNHKVKESNADRVDKYHYYWDINEANYKDKSIYIELYKDKYVFNYDNRVIKTLIVIGIVAILVLTVIIVLRRKAIKNNEI